MQHLFFETIFLKILKSINEPIISFFLLTGKYKAEQMLCDTGLDLMSICCLADAVRFCGNREGRFLNRLASKNC